MGKQFDIVKLKGSENYHTWCFAMQNVLAFKGLDDCLDETEEDAGKQKECKALLSLSVETSIYVHIKRCDSAKSIWSTLKGMFEDKGLSRKVGLLRGLLAVKLEECDGMQQYIDRIMETSNKLTDIGFEINDDWMSVILLTGLTERYEAFIMGIEATGDEIKSDTIVTKLLDSQSAKPSGEAFFGQKSQYQNKRKNKNAKKRKCFNCGSEKHLQSACDKKKEEKRENAKTAFVAMICEKPSDEWYVDSGASSHMTPNGQLLTNTRTVKIGDIVSASNSRMKVKCAGRATLKMNENEIDVEEVLHVPELSASLLSVSKMVEKGNSVIFNKDGCKIVNTQNALVAECKPMNGVYKFRGDGGMCMLAGKKDSAFTWHRRLGHINFNSLTKMRDGAVLGMEFDDDDRQIKLCETCARGKQVRQRFGPSESKSSDVLELIHSDLMGPMEVMSIGRAKYILTFVDDFSRKVFVYFLKSKSETIDKFIEFKALVENQMNRKIKVFRTDNGTEYLSNEFVKFFKLSGIHHQLTAPYTPQQNGLAERMNRTIVERARCLLFDAELPTQYWAEASNMAVYLINRSVCASHGKPPDEVFFGKKVDVSNLRIFGSPVMVHVPAQKRRKWDEKSVKMFFVGYDANTKGVRCIDGKTQKVTISRDIIFHEKIPERPLEVGCDVRKSVSVRDSTEVSVDDQPGDLDEEQPILINDSSDDIMYEAQEGLDDTNEIANETVVNDTVNDPEYVPDENVPSTSTQRMTTRRMAAQIQTSQGGGKIHPFEMTNFAFFVEPGTVDEAICSPDAENWKLAMEEEMSSLAANKTWTIVDLPENRKAIKAKWVFKTKTDDSGTIVRYKARLVAKGCSQKHGIDYGETFSPVVRYTSIRFLIALAVEHGLKIHQMDAITAFLQGDLDETIYMEQPEKYSDGTKRVCKLNRAIYGLKQAGRQWNIKLDAALRTFGLNKSRLDPCIYYTGDLNLFVAIYVDDFLLFYETEKRLEELKMFLTKTFKMKDIGPARNCIGVRIQQGNGIIELDQASYIREMLERFGMNECKPMGTPSDTNQKLSTQMVNEKNSLVGKVPYQEAVGSLLYLSQATRPDIAFAVNDVSRFNANHGETHWSAVKRIFRYLRGTIDFKLTYKRSKNSDLHAYCDADWASDVDKRRSCTGFVTKMSGAAISWMSKRQPIVALSSTEAEYIAMSSAVGEIIWLKQLADEINANIVKRVPLHCDNQSTIKLAESDAFRPRTKHIDIRYHHLREKVDSGVINIVFTPTKLMAADSLTKAVTKEKHQFCAMQFGLIA